MMLTSSTSQIFKNVCVVEISVHPVRGVFVVFVDVGIGGNHLEFVQYPSMMTALLGTTLL